MNKKSSTSKKSKKVLLIAKIIIEILVVIAFVAFIYSKSGALFYKTGNFSFETDSKIIGWKTYTDIMYGYSFDFPVTWGIGNLCGREKRNGFVGIGPENLNYPSTNCGTMNIPPTMSFYIDSQPFTLSSNDKVVEEKIMIVDGKEGKYLSLGSIDPYKAGYGSSNYLLFSVPLSEDKYLIATTGSYSWPTLKDDFQGIISTLEFEEE